MISRNQGTKLIVHDQLDMTAVSRRECCHKDTISKIDTIFHILGKFHIGFKLSIPSLTVIALTVGDRIEYETRSYLVI